jgi:hypothetical protein
MWLKAVVLRAVFCVFAFYLNFCQPWHKILNQHVWYINSFPSIYIIGELQSIFRDVIILSATSTFSGKSKSKNIKDRVTKIEFMLSAILKLSLQTVLLKMSVCWSSTNKRVTVQDPNTRWRWIQFYNCIRRGPQNWHRIWSPELASQCSPQNFHRLWSSAITVRMGSRIEIARVPQKCHPYVDPTNITECGSQKCNRMWSPELPWYMVPRNANSLWSPTLITVYDPHNSHCI